MKHKNATYNTKAALAGSLKELMLKKPLGKITISEIADGCGMNRNTFYYHFEDIYAAVKWILEQETAEAVSSFDLISEHETVINFFLDYIERNSSMLNNICNSLGRSQLYRFFLDDMYNVLLRLINEVERRRGLCTDEEYKVFLATFFSGAIANVMITRIQSNASQDREKIISFISDTLTASIPNSLSKRSKQNEPSGNYTNPSLKS